MADLTTLEHFRAHGWARIPTAFSAVDAAAMCDVIWAGLAKAGIHRADPSTWTKARPEHLQHLKSDPVFGATGTARTISAINEVLEGQSWPAPTNSGAFFLQFPTGSEWDLPATGWHLDGNYAGQLVPPYAVKLHAMLNDVGPRCGGMNILSGSHRLVHRWFTENPPAAGARSAQLRKSLQRHPYVRDLFTAADPKTRVARFHARIEEVDGIPLQVVENTSSAGDIILMHGLLLHAAPAAHLGEHPRFVLNTDIVVRPWW
jgi:ectoine hydroxylase-related dioxygenase (phytanoyl-CoA dioxygenase family)